MANKSDDVRIERETLQLVHAILPELILWSSVLPDKHGSFEISRDVRARALLLAGVIGELLEGDDGE